MSDVLTPVGRLVFGDPFKPFEKTVEKTGEKFNEFACGIAIPKGAETDWKQTEWGAKIAAVGNEAYGPFAMAPTFSWKIIDGDSAIPNKKGKVPRDREGYAGHWVLTFASRFAPQVTAQNGREKLTQPGSIKPGYYVQIFGNVKANGSQAKPAQSPGVYLNLSAINLAAYGQEIVGTPEVDTAAVGFGNAPLPAGASATPLGMSQPPAAPAAPQPPAAPPPSGIVPNHAFAAGQVAPPPAPPARQMTALATATYDAYRASGWTDDQLIQNGLMLA